MSVSLRDEAVKSVDAQRAIVVHQPEYNLPWRVEVRQADGTTWVLTHTATRARAREVAAQWNGRSPCKVSAQLLVEAYRRGAD